jgi:hypothetical protein
VSAALRALLERGRSRSPSVGVVNAAPAPSPEASLTARLLAALEASGGRSLSATELAAAVPGVDRVRARCNELARAGCARRGQGPYGEAVWRRAHGKFQ